MNNIQSDIKNTILRKKETKIKHSNNYEKN